MINIWGALHCAEGFECREGYEGPTCNQCTNTYRSTNGIGKKVDPRTGEGILCEGSKPHIFEKFQASLRISNFDITACDCNQFGTDSCNEFSKCKCRPGFKGQKCDKCYNLSQFNFLTCEAECFMS